MNCEITPPVKQGLVFRSRDTVLGVIYDSLMTVEGERRLAEAHGIDLARFRKWAKGAMVVGCRVDGIIAGGMVLKNGEVHIGIDPQFRARWLRHFRPMLTVGFAMFGPRLMAKVGTDNHRARKFVEAVGCTKVGGNAIYTEYEVLQERMKYVGHH